MEFAGIYAMKLSETWNPLCVWITYYPETDQFTGLLLFSPPRLVRKGEAGELLNKKSRW